MVSNRDYEAVLDPKLPEKPTSKALKKALLVALRCVDPDSQKRPKMGHAIHMLEVDDFPYREVSLAASFTSLLSSQSHCSFVHTNVFFWITKSIPRYILVCQIPRNCRATVVKNVCQLY